MRPDTVLLIDGHIKASRWFIAHPPVVKRLGEPYVAMMRNLMDQLRLRR